MVSQNSAPMEENSWQIASSRRSRRRNPGGAPAPCHGGLCGGGAVPSARSIAAAAQAGVYDTVQNETVDPLVLEKATNRVRERVSRLKGTSFARATDDELHVVWEAARAIAFGSANSAASSSSASTPGIEKSDMSEHEVAKPHEAGAGRIVCLGIGSVVGSVASAWQLALACHISETLGITDRAWADPQMQATDVAIGEAFGFTRMDPNVAPETAAMAKGHSGPLLLFMPHCDRALYERVLAANWEGDTSTCTGEDDLRSDSLPPLGRVVLFGNSFKIYVDRDDFFPTTVPASDAVGHSGQAGRMLQRLGPLAHERLLIEFDPCPEAFNDTAILTFSCEALIAEALAGRNRSTASMNEARNDP